MRKLTLALTSIFFSTLVGIAYASPSNTTEVACSTYGADAVSCDQCFDGGTDYAGDTVAKNFSDTFINSSSEDLLIARNGGLQAGPVKLQSSVQIGESADYGVAFPQTIFWFQDDGEDVAVLFAGTSTHIAQMNGGVLITAVSSGADKNKPAFRYEYITTIRPYDFVTKAKGAPITHKECAFVAPRWCGDGIKSNGEICDDGAQNGQPGKCNSVCTDTVEPAVSCDNLTVSTTTGTAPLAVTVSCNATNASSYRIDCNNGTTNLSSSTTCTYNVGGTFTPRCTINGSVTSPACTKTITVGNPPPTPLCSSTLSGSVDFPLASNTPNLCSIGSPVDFAANIVGATTYYTWRCRDTGGNTSPICRADYDVPPLPADLALKKYVNGQDAQNNATAVELANNANFIYTVTIQNVGTGPLVASLTTVSDPLPAGVTLRSTPTGVGWSCTGSAGAVSWSCARNDGLAVGSFFPTITVLVTVNSSPTYLPNTATVTNPNDANTANNTDPAVIHISSTPPLACIPGTRTGPQTSPITAATPGLCPAGQAVGGFTSNTVGTLTTYTWSCNGSAVGGACSASYDTNTTTPACNSISVSPTTGNIPLASSITCNTSNATTVSIACGNGQTISGGNGTCNYVSVGTFTPRCTVNGTISPASCVGSITATNTPVACIPGTRTGPQTSPITAATPGLCPAGQAVGGFTSNTVGTLTTYTWSCNGSAVGGACSASYDTNTTTPACNSISVSPTTGNIPLASSITCNTSNATTVSIACGNGQTISGGNGTCNYVSVGTFTPRCTVNGTISPASCIGSVTATNIVACIPGTRTGPQTSPITAATPGLCPAGQAVGGFTSNTVGTLTTYTWSCNGSAVGGACSASYNSVTPPAGAFNLSVKKYIGTNDAQTPATAVSVSPGAILTYQFVVTNSGTGGANTGSTILQDILPSGVEYNGATPWTNGNWNCNYTSTGRTITCSNNTDRVASGANLGSTIFVPFRVTASEGQTVGNITAIDNPLESARCTATGSLPSNSAGTCTLDVTNSDPAYFTVGGGGGGGSAVVGKICINNVASCANYNSIIACNAAGAVGCEEADIPGQLRCQNRPLDCSGGGGGGGGGGCGDGVLQNDEECDVVGAPWCQSCRVSCLNNVGNCTNPGSNPIMDIWMTIPRLTHARLGYSWLDGVPGRLPFEENRMILGVGTKAFTLADIVGFGIRTRYAIPLIIEADKRICLKSSGTALNSETICTTFGDAAALDPTVVTWTRPLDGKHYVMLGKGDFQYQETRTGPYFVRSTSGPNDIDLFKGSRLYRAFGGGTPTLNSAFFGTRVGDAAFTLATDTVNLVSLPVRVSAALVGTTATPVNRSIENFISQTSLYAFLSSIRSPSSVSSTTTIRNDSSSNANINLNIRTTGDKTVSNMAQLLAYAYNGNQNIIAIKGNLTLENCPNNTFVMAGVRSVIVEGHLILKCNTTYASSDTASSWAWIVKGGNILVDGGVPTEPQSGVSKLTGVYVTVPELGIGGEFRSIGGLTSQHILRVDGSFYGNARPLLDSRLYARGTSAYEILTTGTILSYSNRALINPPPLLSEYLRNYSVERVVR